MNSSSRVDEVEEESADINEKPELKTAMMNASKKADIKHATAV